MQNIEFRIDEVDVKRRGTLVLRVSPGPIFIALSDQEALTLLKESGAKKGELIETERASALLAGRIINAKIIVHGLKK